MFQARIFICHNVDFSASDPLEAQVFQQLCQRLQETGAQIVMYPGRPMEEGFLAFVYQRLSSCEWFLIFQTPELALVPAISTAINIAQERVNQGQMQGILRFSMQEDTAQNIGSQWTAIPTVGASYDYPRAIEKLILALSLNAEITAKEVLIPPPPPPPTAAGPLLLSAYDTPHYDPATSAQSVYRSGPVSQPFYDTGTVYDQLAASAVPYYDPSPTGQPAPQIYTDPTSDRPVPPARINRLKDAYASTPKLLLIAPVLAIALILGFLFVISPLHALVGQQNSQSGLAVQATGTATASIGVAPTPTLGTTIGVLHPQPTPTSPTGVRSTPTAGVTPTKPPTVKPTPTPKPKPCPATIQDGSKGTLVTTLQKELNARGMKGSDGKVLTVDGDFGANTVAAVKSWQSREKISVDGIVGPDTWRTLGNC